MARAVELGLASHAQASATGPGTAAWACEPGSVGYASASARNVGMEAQTEFGLGHAHAAAPLHGKESVFDLRGELPSIGHSISAWGGASEGPREEALQWHQEPPSSYDRARMTGV